MLPSGLPEAVADEEPLARFLTSSSLHSATVVKPAAFMPSPKDGNTSVFRHPAEPIEALVAIARAHVVREKNLHGVAMCRAEQVRLAGLTVTAQEPPPRHANIGGWPVVQDDPEQTKAQRKERALLIAQSAMLVRL
jgi:hypothetical protein